MFRLFLAALALALASPSWAVQPDEILDDPVLESRARDISAGLRCLVCRNESIDESNAELARDMRLLVRERLVEGDSNTEVMSFIVERYGEYVLLRPTTDGANIILWVAAPVLFLISILSAGLYLRRRENAPEPSKGGLSAEEEKRLKELLDD
ncbi:cytochrome c-type biogenesis protein CcmH [Roseinatronobacter thiooxidans]|uniref:Cytochrome c-type biogenesis protein n=2 Tax=Roseinatronobacter thiooxidans TaxID=121821 RepID=A0A2W7QLV4_9RHOB|nr:cytochrome c-type biogenesis protein CcmH [Roseinatronobacter thiooxidans]